jgi:drug/metabolite transporter (DMT)-like permease
MATTQVTEEHGIESCEKQILRFAKDDEGSVPGDSKAGGHRWVRPDWPVIAAFFAIYVIWGSTFLGIRVAVLLVPPWFCAGVRFFTAGVVLYAYARLTGVKSPTAREWRSLAVLGMLMFSVTYGALFWAEQYVPSGITSVLEALIPLFTMGIEVFVLRQQRFHARGLVAVAVGFVGVAVMLLRTGGNSFGVAPCLVVMVAGIAWSLGAVLTRVKTGQMAIVLPESRVLTSGAQMMIGGAVLLAVSASAGEMHPFPVIPAKAAWALVYLIVAGSLVGFTAFVYLLGKMPASRVASHAYVNPVVALALGYFLGGEVITMRTLVGAGLVVGSVVMTLAGPKRGSQ